MRGGVVQPAVSRANARTCRDRCTLMPRSVHAHAEIRMGWFTCGRGVKRHGAQGQHQGLPGRQQGDELGGGTRLRTARSGTATGLARCREGKQSQATRNSVVSGSGLGDYRGAFDEAHVPVGAGLSARAELHLSQGLLPPIPRSQFIGDPIPARRAFTGPGWGWRASPTRSRTSQRKGPSPPCPAP